MRNLQAESLRSGRTRKPINLLEAKTISLLYYLPDEETYKLVESLVAKLSELKVKVRVVAYTPLKFIPHYFIPKLQQDIITQKDLSWTKKPTKAFVADFLMEPFDILIDLSLQEHLPLLYLASLSKAGMKIGKHIEEHEKFYDLMIAVTGETGIEEFYSHIMHYLEKINSNVTNE